MAESSAPAYIPKIIIDGLPYPMLLCDLRELTSKEILGYDVPKKRLQDMSLIYGVKRMREMRNEGTAIDPATSIFSILKYWNLEVHVTSIFLFCYLFFLNIFFLSKTF